MWRERSLGQVLPTECCRNQAKSIYHNTESRYILSARSREYQHVRQLSECEHRRSRETGDTAGEKQNLEKQTPGEREHKAVPRAQSAVCGKQRWSRIIEHISHQGIQPVQLAQPAMQTTQGIGGQVKVQASYNLPIGIAGINGLVTVTVIDGDAPFLVPIPLLFSLGMTLDLPKGRCVWKTLEGRSTQFVTLHSQHIAIPLFCFASSGWKLPSTHFALHDNLPVGVYHEESLTDGGVPTAIYAQVEAKKNSDVAEIVVASSQRPTCATGTQEKKVHTRASDCSMGACDAKGILPRAVLLANQASHLCDPSGYPQASDRYLPPEPISGNSIIPSYSDSDIRWRDHGKCIGTFPELSKAQIHTGSMSSPRQFDKEASKSIFNMVDMPG
eukprot:6456337-Amphidinium_carterae.2